MSDQWHCVIDGEIVGPLSAEEMLRRISSNQIDLDSLVWKKGMSAWAPLRNVPELRAAAWAKTNAGAASSPIPPQSSPSFARSQSDGRDYGSSRLEKSSPSPYPFAAHKPKRFRFEIFLLIFALPWLIGPHTSVLRLLLPSSLNDPPSAFLRDFFMIEQVILDCSYAYYVLTILDQSWFIIKGNPQASTWPIKEWYLLLIPLLSIIGVFALFWGWAKWPIKEWHLLLLPLLGIIGAFAYFWGWAKSYNKTLDAFHITDAPRATEWIFFVLSVSGGVAVLTFMVKNLALQQGSVPLVFIVLNRMIYSISTIAAFWQMYRAINYFADQAEEQQGRVDA